MSDVTIEKIITEIQSLSPDQRAELIHVLNEHPAQAAPARLPVTPRIIGTYTPKDRAKEWAWLAQHGDKYAGQWVALDGDNLLSHGLDLKEVMAQVEKTGVNDALVVRAEASDTPPYIGFWEVK